jgi:Tfp pilus assembly protein FimT
MKLPPSISRPRIQVGYLLMECIVYMAVFAIITGVGMATFYLCWDDSKALLYATDDIAAALHAGERWRADIRSATGKITIETTADAADRQGVANGDGQARPGQRVALGTGIEIASRGNTSAAAVHV